MNRNTVLSIIALLVIIAGVGAYLAFSPSPVQAPGAGTPAASSTPFAGTPYTEHSQYADIVANFPTTTPLTKTAGAQADTGAISAMQSWVQQTIAQFKSDAGLNSMTPAQATQMGLDNHKLSLQITYLIGSSQNTLSYIFTIYEYTGGAHDNTLFKTFTFDTRSGQELALGDLFKPGADYLASLSQQARAKLPGVIGQGYDFTTIKDGTTPDAKNFQDWFFDGTDFVVLFPPYQVASYAAGPQTLRVPKSQLFDVLKTDYH